jgi:hypothetical protein
LVALTRYALIIVSAGLVMALLSSFQPGRAKATYPEIMGCEVSCNVAAAGWPVPYLIDYPGISVVGSANLSGGFLGEDKFRGSYFALTWGFWTLACGLAGLLGRAVRRASELDGR